jgi:hypothetical protein
MLAGSPFDIFDDLLARAFACSWALLQNSDVRDSLFESMPLDTLREQASSRPLSHGELVQLQRIAARAGVFADLGRQGYDLARAA